ncbi:metal-dependent hydrolase [Skermania sp. ID1734]|uniref:metal-dependent hydrolase n=1 Tax=Skermania sp. ID1734 TaxID=2597516 RepID=UPI00117EA24A|nr:metal-dependent hydrolase [Skermania sp. ID1734]TSE00126.1 metal-dependent hydrolase [Skermania sp. ID1734]
MSRKVSALDPGKVDVHARNVSFDWRNTPLHWMALDPVASHLISALTLLLPEGERMFCAAFTEALPLIADEKLREDVLGFIGQESMHARTHDKAIEEFLEGNGIDVRPFVAHAEYIFRTILGPRTELGPVAQRQYLLERLAVISGLEHMFAFLGDWIINADLERFGADPAMLDLYRWHGAEEVEHRNVAHDVAEYFDMSYTRRNLAMVIAVFSLLLFLIRGAKFLTHEDPALDKPGYPRMLWRIVGSMRRGALPSFSMIGRSLAHCLKPGYSPEVVGNTAQALAYLATSPAARAAAS